MVVAADGINSAFRRASPAEFGTSIDERLNYFCWLGSTREFDAFEYFFRETKAGPCVAHCYQYEPGMSTWVIEMPPSTYEGLRTGQALDAASGAHIRVIEDIFEEELEWAFAHQQPFGLAPLPHGSQPTLGA